MTDTSVKYFSSTMSGAPSLTRAANTLIPVLDACLINGFGGVTLSSLIINNNIATATVNAGHGFSMYYGSAVTGPVILIQGANNTLLNNEFRIASVPSSTEFTFYTSGISNQTATGTITAKRAPLGFGSDYSATNIKTYRSSIITSSRPYLRVDDSGTQNASVNGFISMSDVNTGIGQFPAATSYLYKIDSARSSSPWHLFGDTHCFYLVVLTNNANTIHAGGMFFGDFTNPFYQADGYASGLIAGPSGSNTSLYNIGTSGSYESISRSYTQAAGAVSFYRFTHTKANALALPCPVNGGMVCAPIEAWESSLLPRGVMPGVYAPLNAYTAFTDLAIYDNPMGISGRTLMFKLGANAGYLFDLTGPWR